MAAFFSTSLDLFLLGITVWIISKLLIPNFPRAHVHLTPLKGPESKSFFFGVGRYLINAPDAAIIYEEWASRFGLVYKVPGMFGRQRVILCDPKAVAHFYIRETTTYVQPPISKLLITKLLGGGIIIAEGEDHKRMRKALTPAFSPGAIRRLSIVFLDSVHKVKESWDGILESSADGRQSIDVQTWMNRVSLDSMGIAGFSHDFNSLGGQSSSVASLFDSLAGLTPSKSFITRALSSAGTILFLLGTIFPVLFELPTEQIVMFRNLRKELGEITEELLEKTKKEKELGFDDEKRDKSIIGLLIKAEDPESRFHLSKEEISAQMITLLLAGYETTSISITWTLIELCNHPRIQDKLREELRTISSDLTWDQVNSTLELTFLDAVVHEVLRLHPPVDEVTRIAKLDDVLPLSTPLSLSSPSAIPWPWSSTHPFNTDSVVIPKGTLITVPIACINKSEVFWGSDAKAFRPERWVQLRSPGPSDHDTQSNVGIPKAAQEISGHRHLLTFADGPRTCLGKGFAITEFKLVLAFLVRNYIFEFECENDNIPKIDMYQSILPRPKLEGQEGARVPLSVKRVE